MLESIFNALLEQAKHAVLHHVAHGVVEALNNDGKDTSSSPEINKLASTSHKRAKSAQIKSIDADFDVFEGGKKGMNIKISFDVQGMKGKLGKVRVYFYFEDGRHVVAWERFSPEWDNTTYTDLKIFMPYAELHLRTGKYDIKFYASVVNLTLGEEELAQSDWYHMRTTNTYTSFGTLTTAESV